MCREITVGAFSTSEDGWAMVPGQVGFICLLMTREAADKLSWGITMSTLEDVRRSRARREAKSSA